MVGNNNYDILMKMHIHVHVPSQSSLTTHVCSIVQYGNSPLMVAVRNGRTEVVSLLVKAGAALDLKDQVNMWH